MNRKKNKKFVIIKRTRLVINHSKIRFYLKIRPYGIVHVLTDRSIVIIICQCPPVKELGRMENKSKLEIIRRSESKVENLKVKKCFKCFILLGEVYKCLAQKALT